MRFSFKYLVEKGWLVAIAPGLSFINAGNTQYLNLWNQASCGSLQIGLAFAQICTQTEVDDVRHPLISSRTAQGVQQVGEQSIGSGLWAGVIFYDS